MPRKKTQEKIEELEAEMVAVADGADEPVALPDPGTPERPEEFTPREMPLGDRRFTIAPIARRGGVAAYDQAADFMMEAMPLLQRLLGQAAISDAPVFDEIDTERSDETAAALMATLAATDLRGVVREMRDTLPVLARLACAGTDPEITVDEIKALAGSPLSTELLAIVMAQIEADRILEMTVGLGGGFAFGG